jgi:single-stranded-DNA-specific exonuclease
MAAGLTIDASRVDELADFLEERLAAAVARASEGRALVLDAVLATGGVNPEMVAAMEAGGPYGAGWPAPRCAVGPARLLRTCIVGNGHVRGIANGDDGKSFKWIAFRAADTPLGSALLSSAPDTRWWLAGTIKRDEWTGGTAAEMHVEDAAPA